MQQQGAGGDDVSHVAIVQAAAQQARLLQSWRLTPTCSGFGQQFGTTMFILFKRVPKHVLMVCLSVFACFHRT
jgi:hypothetical protein